MSPSRVPRPLRSIRVRLAITSSLLLFGITALALAVVYLALAATIPNEPLNPLTVKKFVKLTDGTVVYKPGEQFQVADLASVQRAVNYQALTTLRDYSLVALAAMFVLSLLIGWWVARRALRPVAAITETAGEISATDLSRRIDADGPQDELHTLADTIDGMLDRLDRAFQAERTLLEDVSHELRNPIAVIRANVEGVLANDQSTAAERTVAADTVLRSTTRMGLLLEDLLAAARMRSEAFVEEDVDLARLAEEVVAEHRAMADGRDLRLEVRAASGPTVYADPAALARAVGNLVSNAVRLAPAGSTVRVAVGSRAGWAWLAVEDEGPGIPASEQERVFERFHRGSEPRGTGSGLGLPIARQIVEGHGGRLTLTSEVPGGSTFLVQLPDRAAVAPDRRGAPPDVAP